MTFELLQAWILVFYSRPKPGIGRCECKLDRMRMVVLVVLLGKSPTGSITIPRFVSFFTYLREHSLNKL